MIAGYKPRSILNRSDQRLRGLVTWLPMDGHFANFGDIGGAANIPPSTARFSPSPLTGTYWKGDTATSSAEITAGFTPAALGVSGAALRTMFFEGCIVGAGATFHTLFSYGATGTATRFNVSVRGNLIDINCGGGGGNVSLVITNGAQTTNAEFFRAVIRYDGTNVLLDVYSFDPATRVWTSTSTTLAITLATSTTALALYYSSIVNTVDGTSGLSYLGIVGGYSWSDAETRAFLLDPSALWSPGPARARYVDITAVTYNDTISDAVTAADSVAAALTTSGSVSDAATGADSLSVALTARPALADAATAADSTAAALTARPTITDTATGADTSAAALTANAAISDPVTAGDAMVGGKLTSDPITDTVAGADSLAVALTARPATSDAVAGADSQAAALTARPALSDSVTAGDTIAPALTTAATTADAATAADAVAGVKVTSATLSDGATAGEAATVAATFAATLTDGVTAGDGVTGTTGEQVDDSVTAGDGAAVSATFNVAFADGVAAGDDVTASGGTPPAPSTGITGGGPLVPMPRRRRWRVRTPGGLLEGFDTAEAAYARFEELYGDPAPAAPTKGTAAPRRISVPSLPPRTVALGDADATRSFARLLRDMQAEREGEARARVVAMLDQIALDAAYRAAQLEDDDEAAAVLLLM